MKVGDLVKLIMVNGSHLGQKGLLIDRKVLQREYRFDVMLTSGKIINGIPEQYLEVISESR